MLRSLPPDEFDCHVALPGPSPLATEFAAAGAELHVVPMERLSTSHGAAEWAGYVGGWPVAVGRLESAGHGLSHAPLMASSVRQVNGQQTLIAPSVDRKRPVLA